MVTRTRLSVTSVRTLSVLFRVRLISVQELFIERGCILLRFVQQKPERHTFLLILNAIACTRAPRKHVTLYKQITS